MKKTSGGSLYVAIGLPCSFPLVYEDFMGSLFVMERECRVTLFRARSGHDIGILRNSLVEMALEAECTHLLQLDTDMIIHPKALMSMLARDVDIIGAVYYQRYPPFTPCAVRLDSNTISYDEALSGELFEVDRVGSGCMLTKMDVFKKVEYPYFKTCVEDKKITMTDDYYFCDKAREAGYKIYVDTSVPCTHIAQVSIDASWHRRSIQVKELQDG